MDQIANLTSTVTAQQEAIEELKSMLTGPEKNETDLSEPNETCQNKNPYYDSDPFGLMFNRSELSDHTGDDFFAPLQDTESSPEFGDEVLQNIADGMNKTVTRPYSKESYAQLTKKLKIPSNCKSMVVPKMNPEIWNHLPGKARINDLNIQQQQHISSLGLVSLTQIADEVAKYKDRIPAAFGKKILQLCMDGANALGHGFQVSIGKRRSEVKQYLHSDYANICSSSTPVTEYLFGDDLKDLAKSSKASMQLVKRGYTGGIIKDRNNRFVPYSKGSKYQTAAQPSSGSLNRFRPSYGHPMNNRRGGYRPFTNRVPQQQNNWKSQGQFRQTNQ